MAKGIRHDILTGVTEEFDYSPAEEPAKTKKQRIAEVTAEYKSDLKILNDSWLSAAVADGANEASTKASIVQQIEERTYQFKSDIASIRSS